MIKCERKDCKEPARNGVDNPENGYTYACDGHAEKMATPIDRSWVHCPSEGLFPVHKLKASDHDEFDQYVRAEIEATGTSCYLRLWIPS